MQRMLFTAAAVLVSLPSLAFAAPKAAQPLAPQPLVPRALAPLLAHPHALLQLERHAGDEAEESLRAAGATLVSAELRVWKLPRSRVERLVPALAASGALREVQPDRPRPPLDHVAAGDPLLPAQWWLSRVGADRVEPPGPGVPVAVIDSGVDLSHEEFVNRPDTRALNEQRLAGTRQVHHGTAVASVAAGPANGVGLVGVYPGAALLAWDATHTGEFRSSDVIRGLAAVSAAAPRSVINLSFGGSGSDPLENAAILRAVGRGALVVAAAGNDRRLGSPRTFPATLPHVLTVAATDQEDRVAAFSTRSISTDLAAPGTQIPVAVPTRLVPTGYTTFEGTSFAAPIVSGAAAWVWTARPQLDRTQLFQLLRTTARDLEPAGRDPDTGFGLLDLPTALTAPAPLRDPFEPNDDIDQVKPRGLFQAAKPPLTLPGRATGRVLARLDVTADPEDVYRVWVPPQRRVTLTLTSEQDVDLELWGANARSVLATGAQRRAHLIGRSAAQRRPAREVVAWTNRGKTGVFVYADVFVRSNVGTMEAQYLLRVTTARAPR